MQCKNIAKKEKTTTLKDIRLFCINIIFPVLMLEKEEHSLFIGFLDDAFTILGSGKDKFCSFIGYFMNHFKVKMNVVQK